MKTATVGQGGINERLAQIDAPARALQHALDKIAHGAVSERERGAVRDSPAGKEDLVGRVDPHLFYRRIIEIRLQRSEARERSEHLTQAACLVVNGRDTSRQREVVVPAQLGAGDRRGTIRFGGRVEPLGANTVAHALGDGGGCGCWSHRSIITNSAWAVPKLSTGTSLRPRRCRSRLKRGPARHPGSREIARIASLDQSGL